MRLRLLAAPISCLALAVGLAACGGGGDEGGDGQNSQAPGTNLTIYSSLPLQGTSRGQSEAVIAGEKLGAGRAGARRQARQLTRSSTSRSTTPRPRTRAPRTRARRRRTPARRLRTSRRSSTSASSTPAAAKVSIPILNKGGIPQISPSNTYVGLTTDDPGSEPGEPQKYYPTGKRTYARVVPRDTIQGAALVATMKEDGCKAVTLWNDGSTYGAGLARNIELSAKQGRRSRSRTSSAPTRAPRTTARWPPASTPTASCGRA